MNIVRLDNFTRFIANSFFGVKFSRFDFIYFLHQLLIDIVMRSFRLKVIACIIAILDTTPVEYIIFFECFFTIFTWFQFFLFMFFKFVKFHLYHHVIILAVVFVICFFVRLKVLLDIIVLFPLV
jgi:hypothetical protein